jgi:hypothetical protein
MIVNASTLKQNKFMPSTFLSSHTIEDGFSATSISTFLFAVQKLKFKFYNTSSASVFSKVIKALVGLTSSV